MLKKHLKKFVTVAGLTYLTSWTLAMTVIYYATILSGRTRVILTFNEYNELFLEFPLFLVGAICSIMFIYYHFKEGKR